MTVNLTPELEQRLEHLATQSSRTPDELAHEALNLYLCDQEELSESLREAEEQADREGWLTSEEVLARVSKRFSAS